MNDSDRYHHEVTSQQEQEMARDLSVIELQNAVDLVCDKLTDKGFPAFARAIRLSLNPPVMGIKQGAVK